ncbi:hypothetical protein FPL11_06470 [Spiribacter aquaticus]|uniref:Glycosyltransferase RgtA/B/C/D-like domain-containing protein n=1 Tax=Spiribacter aquaticus TaxID=1935996 RepID=A0A557RGM8_9GAMM|nr:MULTISPECIES: DUF6311 domain-containing protein [Spiribacter]KAF0280934.1 hypothetical protein BA897_09880 [Spiribacter roseus]TVO64308.1 hypothetical protein FPL11_06470 [Spiribacter aquaticus]
MRNSSAKEGARNGEKGPWTHLTLVTASIAASLAPVAVVILLTLPLDWISGSSSFWRYLVSDRAQHVTGYLYFIQQPWSFDFLKIDHLGSLPNLSVVSTDSIPLVALIGKVYASITGTVWMPFGIWYVACWLGNALFGVLIARYLGVRNVLATAAVAILLGAMPFWLMRWYHLALHAHFLILASIWGYLAARRRDWCLASGLFLFVGSVSALIHPYLWAMTFSLWATTTIAVWIEDDNPLRTLAPRLFPPGALFLGGATLAGYFDMAGGGAGGYGGYTLNLIAPFFSTLAGWMPTAWQALAEAEEVGHAWRFFSAHRPDVTGGQYYEGMGYLGLGGLFLIATALIVTPSSRMRELVAHHRSLSTLLTGLLLFVILPVVTFGPVKVFSISFPDFIEQGLSAFRANSRFFWPVAYIAVIGAVLLIWRDCTRRWALAVLITAALLQVLDTHPLRAAIALDSKTEDRVLNIPEWETRLNGVERLFVVPSIECGKPGNRNLKSFIQTIAAWQSAPMTNSFYIARHSGPCPSLNDAQPWAPARPTDLYILFDDSTQPERVDTLRRDPALQCDRIDVGWACRPAGSG